MTDTNVVPFQGQRSAAAFAGLAPEADSLSEGIGSSYGIIGYKGKTWSLRFRGENHVFTRADDGSPSSYIDVIILRAAKVKAKSFYAGYDENSSEGKRPICSSIDGIKPDLDVQTKQADACALCPRNVWKQDATTGRKSRECTDYKRVAALVIPTLTRGFFNGVPLIEPVFLRVPPASLQDIATFGDQMAAQGYHYSTFITRISFDPSVAHPKFLFRAIQLLTDNEAPVVLEQRESEVAKRIVGETAQHPQALAAPAQVQQLAPAQNIGLTPQTQPVQQPQPQQPVQQAQPQPVQQVVQPRPEPTGPVSTGFLDLTANPDPAPVTAAVTPGGNGGIQTSADVGTAVQSDADLDARLAALLPQK